VDVALPEVSFNKYKPGGTSSTFIDVVDGLELSDISVDFTLCPL
jgi:hypothetical protein